MSNYFRGIIGIVVLLMLSISSGYVAVVHAQESCPFVMDRIDFGETISGRISQDEPLLRYCFSGGAGDQIVIDLTRSSGSLDAFLELTNVDGDKVYITNDDRSLTTTDAQIIFELPETGAYVVNATRFDREDGTTQGTFELKLSAGDDRQTESNSSSERPDGCPALYDSIVYGDSYEDKIDDDNVFYLFCFIGQEGDEVVVNAKAEDGELDTLLLLTDLRLEDVLAENDDVRLGNRDSRIIFTLPTDGPYLITVTRYDLDEGTSEGNFILTVELNDGTFSEDDLAADGYAPEPYECNRPLVKQLNQTQWVEQNGDYNFRLNFGCEGQVVVSVFGETFITPYTITQNNLQFTLDDKTYTVESESNDSITIAAADGQSFEFADVGECSTQFEEDIQNGIWYLDENSTVFRMEFLCNDLVVVTLDNVAIAYNYEYNVRADELAIGETDFLFWTDVFILPGSFMSVETEDDAIVFTNVLVDIEGDEDAGI